MNMEKNKMMVSNNYCEGHFHKTSSFYKGNYSYYIEEKKLRYTQQLNAYNNQQKEIARLKRFIEYYMPKPRFVNRAKDREKKL